MLSLVVSRRFIFLYDFFFLSFFKSSKPARDQDIKLEATKSTLQINVGQVELGGGVIFTVRSNLTL